MNRRSKSFFKKKVWKLLNTPSLEFKLPNGSLLGKAQVRCKNTFFLNSTKDQFN
jgi:hypothetical protein